ncbi:cache domain-containing sensor histidine kinase [Paenibacillus nasutitermitis]|uniref:Histidine kinase n=1 Tax=Paenibacillus nasutitermitis TaxID=1652958 RepID=A0A916Z798_9BACL|nr:sensor histidine kinase [Paenibacillus nasutitermitis]GGD78478.1 histidine kinase [Paenibacillus nasutitermitis]
MSLIKPWLNRKRLTGIQFRSKMILSFFLVIGLTALIMGYSYYRIMSRELKASMLEGLEKLTEQTVDTLELHFKTIGSIGYSYFSDTSVQQFLEGTPSFDNQKYYRNKLEGQKMQTPLISYIQMTRLGGEQFSSYYYYNSTLRSMMADDQKTLHEQARLLDGFPLWTVSITTAKNELKAIHTISYVQQMKRITSNSQYPVGYIQIAMDPDILEKAFLGLDNDEGSSYIVDREGTIIFTSTNDRIGKSIAGDPLFTAYRNNLTGSRYADFQFSKNDKKYIGFAHSLSYGGWTVVGSVPLDRILHKVNVFRNTLILIAVISFVFAMLLGSIIANGVTRPLKELNKKMKLVEMGDFQAYIHVKGADELSTIQHSFNKMTAEIRKLIMKVYETELLKKEAEIKALQSQINPHFLYNTLSTIDSLSSINGDMRVSHICLALGNMLRYNLNGGSFATIQEEINHLNQYLSIYQIRFSDQFHYEMKVDEQVEDVVIPKFLIQPLVENAIIHGLEQKLGYKSVQVAIRSLDEQRLEISVADNGTGMDPAAIEMLERRLTDPSKLAFRHSPSSAKTRIGLANVLKRIEMYYDLNPVISIESTVGEGTRIQFILPKQTGGGDKHEDHDR